MPTTSPNSVPFDSATNHWNAGGTCYDPSGAGNLADVVLGSDSIHYGYDGENRLRTVSETIAGSSTSVTFQYDGDGRRVRKQVTGATISDTTYVYDVQGNLAQEYSSPANPDAGTYYLTSDMLGSVRLKSPEGGGSLLRFLTRTS